jgi:WD40 repeat protein
VSTGHGSVFRVNLATLQYIIISESHTKPVVAIAFNSDHSDRFATASLDGEAVVFDLTLRIKYLTSVYMD